MPTVASNRRPPANAARPLSAADQPTAQRIDAFDWTSLAADLDNFGAAVLPQLLTPLECAEIAALYPHGVARHLLNFADVADFNRTSAGDPR